MKNKEYEHFEIWEDIFKKRKHILYLMGKEKGTNHIFVIASYSFKTNQVIIKEPENFMPYISVLPKFITVAKEKFMGVTDEKNQE